jgi:Rix1 complex component involved in 60S ribosome maturation.
MHIIVAHMCCGLTHINEGVQMDTLSILELVLDHFPTSLESFSHKILPSLTDLISKRENLESKSSHTSKGHRQGISSLVSRDVSFNVEGKMSSLKARMKILSKLRKILSVLFAEMLKAKENYQENFEDKTIRVKEGEQIFTRINSNQQKREDLTFEDWLEISNNTCNNNNQYVVDFLDSVYPLLLNSWIEFEPGQLASGINDTSSSRTSLPGMSDIVSILDIFVCLGNVSGSISFLQDSEQLKDFNTYFIHYFALPLTFTKVKLKSIAKQETTNNTQKFAIDFNFVMAKVLCWMFLQDGFLTDTKQRNRYLKQLVRFSIDILENSGLVGKDRIMDFMMIFKHIMMLKKKLREKEGKFIYRLHMLESL